MVQLCLLEKPKPLTPPRPGIRRVFFKNLQDIPQVLSTGPLKAQAKALVPGSQGNVHGGNVEGQAEDATAEIDQQIEQPDAEHISPEQKNAALCFLKLYQQRKRNLELEKTKTPTQKTCDCYFEDCLKLAPPPEKRPSPGGYYRKLYLGLVPHLLTYVKGLESYAFSAKAEAKKRYRGSEKQDYDDVHKTMNEMV
jgi:hypothetical protein